MLFSIIRKPCCPFTIKEQELFLYIVIFSTQWNLNISIQCHVFSNNRNSLSCSVTDAFPPTRLPELVAVRSMRHWYHLLHLRDFSCTVWLTYKLFCEINCCYYPYLFSHPKQWIHQGSNFKCLFYLALQHSFLLNIFCVVTGLCTMNKLSLKLKSY